MIAGLTSTTATPAQRRAQAAHRRARSIELGPWMRLQFEDRHTVHHQVSEVLRVERITDPARIREEIETYAHLVPDAASGWIATLMIEIPDAALRAQLLPRLSAAAHRIVIDTDAGLMLPARANDDLHDRHLARPSGVHFLRFARPDARRLGDVPALLRCDDDAYRCHSRLTPALWRTLCAELGDTETRREVKRNANVSRFEHHHAEIG